MEIENGAKTVEMPEYGLILVLSTVDSLEIVDDETEDVSKFDVHDKIKFFKKKIYDVQVSVGIMSNVLRPAISVLT